MGKAADMGSAAAEGRCEADKERERLKQFLDRTVAPFFKR